MKINKELKKKYNKVMRSYVGMFALSLILYPFIVYPFRVSIRNGKERGNKLSSFLWLFLNDTTKANENDIDWGDYGRFSHNLIGAIQQSIFRNNSWNYKINYNLPNIGKYEKITPKGADLSWINSNEPYQFGERYVEFTIKGERYFRYSYFGKLKWFNPVRLFGYKYVNKMQGATSNRYLFKLKYKK